MYDPITQRKKKRSTNANLFLIRLKYPPNFTIKVKIRFLYRNHALKAQSDNSKKKRKGQLMLTFS